MKRRTEKSRFREKHSGLPAAEIEALWRLKRQHTEAWEHYCDSFHDFIDFAKERYKAGDTPMLTRRAIQLGGRFMVIFNRIVSSSSDAG